MELDINVKYVNMLCYQLTFSNFTKKASTMVNDILVIIVVTQQQKRANIYAIKKQALNESEGLKYMCEFIASSASHLKPHKESKHEGIKYTCDKCEFLA